MKAFKILSLCAFFICVAILANAQTTKTETIAVSGNCGMCKSSIEKAAKSAGATKADWNKDTKVLTVSYKTAGSSPAKIQEAIAAVGYDTRDVKASSEAYDKLHACCKYERVKTDEISATDAKQGKADCCAKDAKSEKADCCAKDAKNTKAKDAACCN